MHILLLADANSIHTQKWAIYLSNNAVKVSIFSLQAPKNDLFNNTNIKVFSPNKDIHKKILYPLALPLLKKITSQIKPDIVHAHYASSYGLLGALLHFRPFIISVWGSDVFEFPKLNLINKLILKYNLKNADLITSTSVIMAQETQLYTDKPIKVIPFGVDTNIFQPLYTKKIFSSDEIIIGTIKTLEPKYGIHILIKAFQLVFKKLPNFNLKLLIVGDGSQRKELEQLSQELNIADKVIFYGKIKNSEVPQMLSEIDLFVALSVEDSESFGVAVVEAMACEKPVVVSDAGGLKEVVVNHKTGIIVEKNNPEAAANAIIDLILNKEKAHLMGREGRLHVLKYYDFKRNVQEMINTYKQVLSSYK